MSAGRPLRSLDLDADGVTITLRGPLVVAALRRRLRIPYRRITGVMTDPLTTKGMIRVAGFALGRRLHGLFRRQGEWIFVSVEDTQRVVRFRLEPAGGERVPLAEVVVGVEDPEATADAVRRARARHGASSS